MTAVTTLKVSTETRDDLKALAERDGLTIESALRKLLRAERQRQMGVDLAAREQTHDDRSWIIGAQQAVSRAVR